MSSVIDESLDQVVGVDDPTFRRFSMTALSGLPLSSYTTARDTTPPKPINHADRRLTAGFILAGAVLALSWAAGERWMLAGATVFMILPTPAFLLGGRLGRRSRCR
jgi:hypothetical protein